MELPEELLLAICEHLQPPRYEDEAALLDYDATRRAAHRPAQCGDELSHPSIFGALTPRTLNQLMANQLMADLPVLERCHVTSVASIVLQTCSIWHRGERVICYRAPPGVSLTFGPEAFPPGVRVVLDVDTAPLPLSVAVWDHETLTDLDATAVPLGYV